jgi:alginate O-acetyltransferase complex protein AlgI
MPQFASRHTWVIRHRNVLRGLFIFSIGSVQKGRHRRHLRSMGGRGFDGGQRLDFFAAWAASLAYTFQLYFDFSGYCDMAIGASLLFNIRLPLNFNSPYKALDIQDFGGAGTSRLAAFFVTTSTFPWEATRLGMAN